jgi:hypothetical protein
MGRLMNDENGAEIHRPRYAENVAEIHRPTDVENEAESIYFLI